MSELKCKKSLYKSTYKKNAFTKGRKYKLLREEITEQGSSLVYLLDEEGREFNFSPDNMLPFYFLKDYFEI